MFLLNKALFKEESKEMMISLFVVFHNKSNILFKIDERKFPYFKRETLYLLDK
jgi:hypothetical protein